MVKTMPSNHFNALMTKSEARLLKVQHDAVRTAVDVQTALDAKFEKAQTPNPDPAGPAPRGGYIPRKSDEDLHDLFLAPHPHGFSLANAEFRHFCFRDAF